MKTPSAEHVRQLASDTWAGICPQAWEALQEANHGHAPAYGDDRWTQEATRLLSEIFETDCRVYLVATGTAANALALAALCGPHHAILCHEDAHINTDECGAPEHMTGGSKLVTFPGGDGKLTPDAIRQGAGYGRGIHSHKPRLVSISQATEAGTVYSVAEMGAVAETIRTLAGETGQRLLLHVDGARFANAAASLDVAPKALTWQAGVDVLCFGGTKNGMGGGDAILFFDPQLAEEFDYRRKQAGHLMAKMRFAAAPWVGMLRSGAWLSNARHANEMARLLEQQLRGLNQLRVRYPVQASAVFVEMPERVSTELHRRGWHFYAVAGAWRLMCSWDTQPEDIAAFVRDLRAAGG
jgi:threonine aldolase